MPSRAPTGSWRALFALLAGLAFAPIHAQADSPQTLQFAVFHTIPHDVSHYTQGLVIHGEKIFESTGLHGFSAVYEKELRTGKILRARKNAQNIFGEGLTLLHDRLFQLSWRNGTGFIYDLALKPLGRFKYETEGWGLTHDGRELIMSDGSAQLVWRDPKTLHVTRQVTVRDGARHVTQLNELEYADGLIYANLWQTDRIVAIDPNSGRVRAWLDLSPLKRAFTKPAGWDDREHVLNGIAHDPVSGHFFVTGKCWPVMFELGLNPPTK